jgi:hypothetical protein
VAREEADVRRESDSPCREAVVSAMERWYKVSALKYFTLIYGRRVSKRIGVSVEIFYLEENDPVPVEDASAHELFEFLSEARVEVGDLGCNFGDEGGTLLLVDEFLEKDLGRLSNHDPREELYDFFAKIR